MAIQVIIDGSEYTLPTNGTNPSWGEELSDLILALVNVSNTVLATGDIATTSFTLSAAAVPVAANVTGLAFSPAVVRSSVIEYSIHFGTTLFLSECGTMLVTYNGSAWELARYTVGDAGIEFTIDNTTGQVKYSKASTGVVTGLMKFRAKSFLV